MGQAKLIRPKAGKARVIIKTNEDEALPTFELDWEMEKSDAIKMMIYAMQLRVEQDEREGNTHD